MSREDATFMGVVASVTGASIRIRLRDDMPTNLVVVRGESSRIGQVGGFVRIPLGFNQLYAICTQVGADAAPQQTTLDMAEISGSFMPNEHAEREYRGFRWMSAVLFGESIGREFERGVSQYPTVGDEVHLVVADDLLVVYGRVEADSLSAGTVAGATDVDARLQLSPLVNRHSAIVGSTGSGKSNLVTVLLQAIGAGGYSSARVLLIDVHGEYSDALKAHAEVFRLGAGGDSKPLWVPYWGLPFDELREVTLGGLQPNVEAAIRDIVAERKLVASTSLSEVPPSEAVTADSPIPFSIRKLWFELDDFERRTFSESNNQGDDNLEELEDAGDPGTLKPNRYPTASPYNQPPYYNRSRRMITRQLELMRSRLKDNNFGFLFSPGDGFCPDLDGKVSSDLDSLLATWIGHSRPVTIFDVSEVPSEVLPTIVGTILRIIYDGLFWAGDLPIAGKQQPLLVVLEEAHRFIQEGTQTAAHRVLGRIAKEGRKYGVGLMLVSQRPTEIDAAVLSQTGTVIALRTTNKADRDAVASSLPDDLGGLINLLPSLRTGEGLFVGEGLMVPSRVRIRRALTKPVGGDPQVPGAWTAPRPDPRLYGKAMANWRAQSTAASTDAAQEDASTEVAQSKASTDQRE